MTSFAPEELFGVGVHRKIDTQRLDCFSITRLELRSPEHNKVPQIKVWILPSFSSLHLKLKGDALFSLCYIVPLLN